MATSNIISKLVSGSQLFILLFTLFFLPLFFSAQFYLGYELPKIFAFRILAEILFFLTCVDIIFFKRYKLNWKSLKVLNKSSLLIYLYILLLIILITINVLSYQQSPNQLTFIWGNYDKRFGIFTILHLLAFLLSVIHILNCYSSDFWDFFPIFLPTSVLINFGISYSQMYLGTLNLALTEGRAVGTFGQANFLYGYMVMLQPFIFYYLLKSKNIEQGIYQGIAFVSIIFTTFWSGSRLGQILEIALLIVFLGTYLRSSNMKLNISRKQITTILITVFVFSSVLIVLTFERFRLYGLVDQTRLLIWQSSFTMIAKNPLLGLGYDVSGYIFPTEMYSIGVDHPIGLDRAHSEYLDIAINIGVPGLLVVMIILSAIVIEACIRLFKTKDLQSSHFLIASLVSISIFLIRSFVDVSGINIYIFASFLFGIIIHLSHGIKPHSNYSKKFMLIKFPTMLILLIPLSIGVFINSFEILAETSYKSYEITKDMNYLKMASIFSPFQERYQLEYLKSVNEIGSTVEFRDILNDSIMSQKIHSSEYYYRIGIYYSNRDELDTAEEYLEKALSLAPVNGDYRNALVAVQEKSNL